MRADSRLGARGKQHTRIGSGSSKPDESGSGTDPSYHFEQYLTLATNVQLGRDVFPSPEFQNIRSSRLTEKTWAAKPQADPKMEALMSAWNESPSKYEAQSSLVPAAMGSAVDVGVAGT